ncbi:MAG: NUDIX domain-containing protein [Alphaproteobacteria bacterium]|nr:NUDIX domain-containing protein [Alphaproteobacteria bacterium]MDD9919747.1 NUDIX domain-containing protein [Alphaproteobacteria bacterium]
MKQRVIVGSAIRRKDEYLFVRQDNKKNSAFPGCLCIVGGGVEPGEDLEEAMRREIREETNIEVKNLKGFNFDYANLDNYKGEPYQLVFLQYQAEYGSGEPKAGDDVSELVWVKESELEAAPLNPSARKLLEQAGIL